MKYFLIFIFFFSLTYAENDKIISLAPNVTEMLYFIGKGDKLIADTTACNYPSDALHLLKIGDIWSINIEKIVSLKPDLVIASYSGNSKDQIERLESLGIKVITLKEHNTADIVSNIILLGNLLNSDTAKKIQIINHKLLNMNKPAHKKKAVIFISLYPFYSASKYSFLGDVLEKAGFDNAVATPIHYPLISEEELTRLNPDVIFIADRFKKELNPLQIRFRRLQINPRIIFVNEDLMSRPGPRIFDFIIEINQYTD